MFKFKGASVFWVKLVKLSEMCQFIYNSFIIFFIKYIFTLAWLEEDGIYIWYTTDVYVVITGVRDHS